MTRYAAPKPATLWMNIGIPAESGDPKDFRSMHRAIPLDGEGPSKGSSHYAQQQFFTTQEVAEKFAHLQPGEQVYVPMGMGLGAYVRRVASFD